MNKLTSRQSIVINGPAEIDWKEKLNVEFRHILLDDFLLNVGFGEAVNNAIEHGDYPIILNLHCDENIVEIHIKDHGKGFNVKKKLHDIEKYGTKKLLNDIVLEERGRGILMMMQIFHTVNYNKRGNEVLLCKENEVASR